MEQTEHEKMVADYLSGGGHITKCPTAYCSVVAGAESVEQHRQALSAHARELEQRRRSRLPLRRSLRSEIHPRDQTIQIPRQPDQPLRRQDKEPVPEETKEETESPATMNLNGLGTTVNKLPFLGADEEVTVYRAPSGHQKVYTTDHAGRRYESNFSPSGRFMGSKELKNG